MSRRVPLDLITQAEAARLRGVTPEAISRLIKRGRLTPFEVAGRVLVRRSEIDNFQKKPAGRPIKKGSDKKKGGKK